MSDKKVVRVLYIDDNPAKSVLKELFEDAGFQPEIKVIYSFEDIMGLASIVAEYRDFDVAFLDFNLFGRNSLELGLVQALNDIGFRKGEKPLVACSMDSDSNKELIKAGCTHKTDSFHENHLREVFSILR